MLDGRTLAPTDARKTATDCVGDDRDGPTTPLLAAPNCPGGSPPSPKKVNELRVLTQNATFTFCISTGCLLVMTSTKRTDESAASIFTRRTTCKPLIVPTWTY